MTDHKSFVLIIKIILYIRNIEDYLKILPDFLAINFNKYLNLLNHFISF